MKKLVKNMLVGGIGLTAGAVVAGKMGKMGVPTEVSENVNAGLSIASTAMPIMGAAAVMKSTEMLYPKRKKLKWL